VLDTSGRPPPSMKHQMPPGEERTGGRVQTDGLLELGKCHERVRLMSSCTSYTTQRGLAQADAALGGFGVYTL